MLAHTNIGVQLYAHRSDVEPANWHPQQYHTQIEARLGIYLEGSVPLRICALAMDASWLQDEQLRVLLVAAGLPTEGDRKTLEETLLSSLYNPGPHRGQWHLRTLTASTPESRDGKLVAHNGSMYLLGGYCTNKPFNEGPSADALFMPSYTVYRLNLSSQNPSWQPLPRLTHSDQQHLPRPGIIACSHGDGIYFYGGYRSIGYVAEVSFINLIDGSCKKLELDLTNSPMEDRMASRLTGVVFQNKWVVARKLIMPAALYYFDFEEHSWHRQEVKVEGRPDSLMYIHELAVYNGSLYAVNLDILKHSIRTSVEVRRLEGDTWRKVSQGMPPAWLQQFGFLETFFTEGVVANGVWMLWGSRSLVPPGASESIDLISPPKTLRITDSDTYFQSQWAASFKAQPFMFNFETGLWSRPVANGPTGILGQEPISRKLHCSALAPDGKSLLIVGGEMVPIPCVSDVPVACHVTEQLSILPSAEASTSAPCHPEHLLEEAMSFTNEDIDDSFCDVEVYAEGNPGQAVWMSGFAMSQRSSMFRRMLSSSMVEGSTRKVELPSVEPQTLKGLRALCHLDFPTLQECTSNLPTLVELFSICTTYMIEPLGTKYTRGLLESRIREPDRCFDNISGLWKIIHTTKLVEVIHQGLAEMVAERLSDTWPDSMHQLQASLGFKALAEEHQTSLKQYVDQVAAQRQLHEASLSQQPDGWHPGGLPAVDQLPSV